MSYKIAWLFLLLPIGGCVEITVYDSPGMQGTVVDAFSSKPIADATLSVKSNATAVTHTLADGSFSLAAIARKVKVLPLPYDSVTPGGTLLVSAPGYQPKELTFHGGNHTDISIALEPAP